MSTSILKLQNGSDIRGIALDGVEGEKVNLFAETAFVIGKAFALWLSDNTGKSKKDLKVGIGMDSRLSGPALSEALAKGLVSEGVKVTLCGLATTPSMFMSIIFEQTKFDGSVMITASHLPFNRNGIKFFNKDGGAEHEDITSILQLASDIEDKTSPEEIKKLLSETSLESCSHFDLISLYADHLKNAILKGCNNGQTPLKGLKIIVDAGNGAGGFFAEKILKVLGADITGSQFLNPDGNFPNHIPNPENKEAMLSIQNATVSNKADLGLIFDTDVDRMSAVLNDGSEVNRDAIIAMIAAILAPENPGSTIVTDSVTSDRLTTFLEEKLGLKHLRYMRGYKNVINKQKELNAQGINCPLAMETSGHGALKENYYLDDGSYLAVKLIIALARSAREGKSLESYIADLHAPGDEGEYRFKILTEDFKSYGKTVLEKFKAKAIEKGLTLPESFEGVRISFNTPEVKGWMLLRLSLHDPVMPMNIEGRSKADHEKIKAIAKELLTGFDKLDMSCL